MFNINDKYSTADYLAQKQQFEFNHRGIEFMKYVEWVKIQQAEIHNNMLMQIGNALLNMRN